MKLVRLLLAACFAAGCDAYLPPKIDSFTVDNANPAPGETVHLIFSVEDALTLSILPTPGEVTGSPVAVQPREPTTYTLRAANLTGAVHAEVTVNAQSSGAASVVRFSVTPSQAPPGTRRTLAWKVHNGVHIALSGGSLGRIGIENEGQISDTPAATTSYVINATSSVGFTPPQASAQVMARVVAPAAVGSFVASPAAILQGEAATLSWDGTALSWRIAANGSTTQAGAAKLLVVRPAATTTYTLTGSGPGGAAGPREVTVTVTPRAGTTLAYTPPAVTSEKLALVANPCAAPCTVLHLRLVALLPVSLRGVALDLPADSSKVALDPATFVTPLDAGTAVLGSGLLHDTLVVGAGLKGTGTAAAADRALAAGAEVAHFSVSLQAAGGQGVVFDGASAFTSFIQSASGRTPGGIAVGKLEAQ